VPVPDDVVDALSRLTESWRVLLLVGGREAKSVIAYWQRALRKLFQIAKVEKGHAHRFRDTFAVERSE
jgi:integrase